MPLKITPADIEAYQIDGAVLIKGLLNDQEVSDLRKGIEANISNPSLNSKVASNYDDAGWFLEDFCTWKENLSYKRIIFQSAVSETAAKLMRSKQVRLYHDHMLVKKKGTQQRTPWHQDQPYYNIEGYQNISFWIPVDPVPLEWTLELVAGSHKGPWYMPRNFLESQAKWFPEGSLSEIPDIDSNPEKFRILKWVLDPGDAVAFHMLTLHSGKGTGGLRRVFSIRMLGDDIIHSPRSWKTSPDFPGLSDYLPAGKPMDHELFPLAWPIRRA